MQPSVFLLFLPPMNSTLVEKYKALKTLLRDECLPSQVLDIPFSSRDYIKLDFTEANKAILDLDLKNTSDFNKYIFDTIERAGAKVGFGGYDEDRVIYKRSSHFLGDEPRSVHLGVDLWAKAGTEIFSPLDATVHSFADNRGQGNYGPTIILSHAIGKMQFYTLYGHLSRVSLRGLSEGKAIKKGEKIGYLGDFPENGDWPPHLHFQIITDLMGLSGDFPGVAKPSEREKYLLICPDPNWILRLPNP